MLTIHLLYKLILSIIHIKTMPSVHKLLGNPQVGKEGSDLTALHAVTEWTRN